MRLRLAVLLTLTLFPLALPDPASAQTYPDRSVKVVVPFGPGGGFDIIARVLADHLSRRMGQPFVVENRPGGGSIVGTQSVTSATPDGYTLLMGGLSNIVFNAGLYKKLSYDPLKDLVPVALVFTSSYVLVAGKDLPYKSPKDVVDAALKNPDGLTVANVGVGSGQQVVGAAFQKITGTKLREISYRSSSAAFPDVLGGRVDLFFDSTTGALPYVTSGQVKGLAVLTAKRHPKMPDVPTMTEVGIPGLEVDSWLGVFAPAGTPTAAIARLRQEIAQALPAMRQPFETNGGEPMDMSPEKLEPFIAAEFAKWTTVIREAGIKLD